MVSGGQTLFGVMPSANDEGGPLEDMEDIESGTSDCKGGRTSSAPGTDRRNPRLLIPAERRAASASLFNPLNTSMEHGMGHQASKATLQDSGDESEQSQSDTETTKSSPGSPRNRKPARSTALCGKVLATVLTFVVCTFAMCIPGYLRRLQELHEQKVRFAEFAAVLETRLDFDVRQRLDLAASVLSFTLNLVLEHSESQEESFLCPSAGPRTLPVLTNLSRVFAEKFLEDFSLDAIQLLPAGIPAQTLPQTSVWEHLEGCPFFNSSASSDIQVERPEAYQHDMDHLGSDDTYFTRRQALYKGGVPWGSVLVAVKYHAQGFVKEVEDNEDHFGEGIDLFHYSPCPQPCLVEHSALGHDHYVDPDSRDIHIHLPWSVFVVRPRTGWLEVAVATWFFPAAGIALFAAGIMFLLIHIPQALYASTCKQIERELIQISSFRNATLGLGTFSSSANCLYLELARFQLHLQQYRAFLPHSIFDAIRSGSGSQGPVPHGPSQRRASVDEILRSESFGSRSRSPTPSTASTRVSNYSGATGKASVQLDNPTPAKAPTSIQSSRNVTVVVVSISDFHSLLSILTVPELIKVHATIVDVVLAAAQKYRGAHDMSRGDSMVITFNGIQPVSDHPIHAVLAAIEACEGVSTLDQTLREEDNIECCPLRLQVGITTGRSIVGVIGTKKMKWMGVIGTAVHEAFKLEKLCKVLHTHVLASDSTAQYCGQAIRMRLVDKVESPTGHVYEIMGILSDDEKERAQEWMYTWRDNEEERNRDPCQLFSTFLKQFFTGHAKGSLHNIQRLVAEHTLEDRTTEAVIESINAHIDKGLATQPYVRTEIALY